MAFLCLPRQLAMSNFYMFIASGVYFFFNPFFFYFYMFRCPSLSHSLPLVPLVLNL